jgi:hypothetical protein
MSAQNGFSFGSPWCGRLNEREPGRLAESVLVVFVDLRAFQLLDELTATFDLVIRGHARNFARKARKATANKMCGLFAAVLTHYMKSASLIDAMDFRWGDAFKKWDSQSTSRRSATSEAA